MLFALNVDVLSQKQKLVAKYWYENLIVILEKIHRMVGEN